MLQLSALVTIWNSCKHHCYIKPEINHIKRCESLLSVTHCVVFPNGSDFIHLRNMRQEQHAQRQIGRRIKFQNPPPRIE